MGPREGVSDLSYMEWEAHELPKWGTNAHISRSSQTGSRKRGRLRPSCRNGSGGQVPRETKGTIRRIRRGESF